MADKKISELTALTGAGVAADDVLAIVDTSATETKKISVSEIFKALPDGTVTSPSLAPKDDQNTGIFFPAADTIAFTEGGVEAMRITSDGRVGIGTNTPLAGIDVRVAPSNFAAYFLANGADFKVVTATGITSIGTSAANPFTFLTSDTERMRIDSSGNVGIGTSSPQSYTDYTTLSVDHPTNGGVVSVRKNGTAYLNLYTDGTLGKIEGANNALLTFLTASTERARITANGSFLMGQTSENSTANGIGLYPSESTKWWHFVAGASSGADYGYSLYSTTASAYRFIVNYAGTISATTTTISGISDQRLKENIEDLDAGLDKIMALKPRKFDCKEGKGRDVKGDRGFIAQEFEQVFPDLVDEWPDPVSEGEEPYKAVRADLIPVLVKAIQELKAELDATKDRLSALEANNA
jgi:uncharacterized protein YaiE (UPF0345 family)